VTSGADAPPLKNGGRLSIVGLGPADAEWLTSQAQDALAQAQDIIGYAPYVARVPERGDQTRLASDNRVEIDRAVEALRRAASGRKVAVVSGGDPGIFAMAAAVFEAIEQGDASWRDLDIEVLPGISAMQAAAARLGAPLGHDFCVISLSDNLKPWESIAKRLEYAARGDFVIVLYNPASRARPQRIHEAFALLRNHQAPHTPVIFAKSVGRAEENIVISRLDDADPSVVDMSTLVIIGSSGTRQVPRSAARPWVYTSRRAP
jgi:precorrin-3B C17-methyltransferase